MSSCAEHKHPDPIVEVEVLERHRMPLELLDLVRPPIPMLPLNRRTGVTEVEIGFDEEDRDGRGAALPALLGQHRL